MGSLYLFTLNANVQHSNGFMLPLYIVFVIRGRCIAVCIQCERTFSVGWVGPKTAGHGSTPQDVPQDTIGHRRHHGLTKITFRPKDTKYIQLIEFNFCDLWCSLWCPAAYMTDSNNNFIPRKTVRFCSFMPLTFRVHISWLLERTNMPMTV